MRKVWYLFFAATIVFSNSFAQKAVFICDSTVNGLIQLRNSISGESFIYSGTPIKKDSAYKIYVLCNRLKTEYLFVYKFPGDSKDIYSRFEVGLARLSNFDIRSATRLALDHLGTENGIKLGMTKETVASLKGNQYMMGKEKGMVTLTYRVNDFESEFLRRYNMPGYTEKFYFSKNKLVKFFFGFDGD